MKFIEWIIFYRSSDNNWILSLGKAICSMYGESIYRYPRGMRTGTKIINEFGEWSK